ncbi:MAG: hypothetical protein CMB16_05480 [Euryarchaeota archaeon]|nr:hypothetical protein [Euryarchaeota archaeon]
MVTFDSEYEPFFQPPGWIIGPIWAILYTTLIISFFTTFNLRNKINKSNTAIWLFVVQLIVNLAWPRVFNSEEYLISLIMIVIMVIFTSMYAYIVYEVNKKGSLIVLPYILWVSFAGMINATYYLHAG